MHQSFFPSLRLFRQHSRQGQQFVNWALHHETLKTFLQAAVLLAIFFAFMTAIQFATPDLPDNDGFYHIKMAFLMRTEGLKPDFRWLPLSILNRREFYDHHFLFHVALMPFTFGDLRLGAKWSSVFFASLAFLSIWWLLHRQRVPYAALWATGLLIVSDAFLYRMSIPRAQSFSLAILALGLHWMLTGKYTRLLPLGFLYVWFYNAFPLLVIMTAIYVLSVWLVERRLVLQPVLYAGIGILLGLFINPYFPYNLIFAYQHILPKILDATSVSVGNEWYPYSTAALLKNSTLAFAAFLSGILALGLSGKRIDVRTATGLLLAIFFGWILFQSRRFIEYFPAFALIFAVFAWAPILEEWIKSNPPNRNIPVWKNNLHSWIPIAIFLVVLASGAVRTLPAAQDSLRNSKPYNLYASASAWLQANTLPGEGIFQTDWDDFPRLFFYNTHNTYLIGLDPTYLQLYHSELYDAWVEITKGRIAQPSQAIAGRFGMKYVLTDLQHKGFIEQAAADPGLKEVYRDNQAIIYSLVTP